MSENMNNITKGTEKLISIYNKEAKKHHGQILLEQIVIDIVIITQRQPISGGVSKIQGFNLFNLEGGFEQRKLKGFDSPIPPPWIPPP